MDSLNISKERYIFFSMFTCKKHNDYDKTLYFWMKADVVMSLKNLYKNGFIIQKNKNGFGDVFLQNMFVFEQ